MFIDAIKYETINIKPINNAKGNIISKSLNPIVSLPIGLSNPSILFSISFDFPLILLNYYLDQ